MLVSDDVEPAGTSESLDEVINHIDELLQTVDDDVANFDNRSITDNSTETDAGSDIIVLDQSFDDITKTGSDNTETGSDITVLDMSDDDISDDEAAPTMFLVQSTIDRVPFVSMVERDVDLESNDSFELLDLPKDTGMLKPHSI